MFKEIKIIIERELKSGGSFTFLITELTKIKDELKYILEIEEKIAALEKEKENANKHINFIQKYISGFYGVFVCIKDKNPKKDSEG